MSNRTIFSAFSAVASVRVVSMIFMAVTTPLLTRFLGASRYGEYATALAIFGIAQIFISSPINNATQLYFSKYDDPDIINEIWNFFAKLATVLALAGAVAYVGLANSKFAIQIFGSNFSIYFYFLAIFTFSLQYREFIRRAFMGLHLEKLSEPLKLLNQIVFSVSAITLVYLNFGVPGVLMSHILGNLTFVLLGIYYLKDKIDLAAVFDMITDTLPKQKVFTYGLNSTVLTLVIVSFYQVDILMLQRFETTNQVGYYKAALVLVEFLWFAPQSLQRVLIQSVSDYWENANMKQLADLSARTIQYALLLSSLLGLGLGFLADDFIPLYFGSEYISSVEPLLILLPGTIGFGISRPLIGIIQARDNITPLIWATAGSAALNLALNYVLIPIYGIIGAAIATSIGYGSLIVSVVTCSYYLGFKCINPDLLLRAILTIILSGLAMYVLSMSISGGLRLVVIPPVGAAIFLITALILKAIPRDDLQIIKNKLQGFGLV